MYEVGWLEEETMTLITHFAYVFCGLRIINFMGERL